VPHLSVPWLVPWETGALGAVDRAWAGTHLLPEFTGFAVTHPTARRRATAGRLMSAGRWISCWLVGLAGSGRAAGC
jgi:hypothetical protein